MHDRCNKKNLSHLRTVLSMIAIPYIYVEKLFLLLFLYKYISIHTLLKSVMQLINIIHYRGIVSIIYYLSYFTDGFNRSCNECIKASLAVKVSSFAFTTS